MIATSPCMQSGILYGGHLARKVSFLQKSNVPLFTECHAGQCRTVATRAELREVIVEMSKAAQVGKLSQGEAQQVTSEV